MSIFYANRNTSEVVERDSADARLDGLDNWTRHSSENAARESLEDARNYVLSEGVLRRPGMEASPTIAPRGDKGGSPSARHAAERSTTERTGKADSK